ncbi:hypothetical protein [Desulfuromonas sp. TF]|uniref:hypothetical protein n=1 Tax=Desulfuromonas sp. TF TaxID=1232410 RepID=UPI00048942CD|nr:hypothetical protein [Desulfuromonas sp. TF]
MTIVKPSLTSLLYISILRLINGCAVLPKGSGWMRPRRRRNPVKSFRYDSLGGMKTRLLFSSACATAEYFGESFMNTLRSPEESRFRRRIGEWYTLINRCRQQLDNSA